MVYDPLKTGYRQSAPLIFNVDFFDFASGAGLKKFYLAGLKDSVGDKYILTDDSGLIADSANYRVQDAADIDYDIAFSNPITIAASEATISYTVLASSAVGRSHTVAWTVYHVAVGGAETSIGTVTDSTTQGTAGNSCARRTVKLSLTSKRINKGEKLRINAISTLSAAGTFLYYIDPSGLYTTGGGSQDTSRATVNIPFEVDG